MSKNLEKTEFFFISIHPHRIIMEVATGMPGSPLYEIVPVATSNAEWPRLVINELSPKEVK